MTKANLIVPFGLWALGEGLIKSPMEFQPVMRELRRLNLKELSAEIKRRKAERRVGR